MIKGQGLIILSYAISLNVPKDAHGYSSCRAYEIHTIDVDSVRHNVHYWKTQVLRHRTGCMIE